jgi:mono/diheme cytochrome c family protein
MILPSSAFRLTAAIAFIGLIAASSGCNEPTVPVQPPSPREQLRRKGQEVYFSSCVSCHNSDPKKPGSIGPEIAGASMELLTARILEAGYPAGYKPKRESHAMPKLPHLKNEIPALHAFLSGP